MAPAQDDGTGLRDNSDVRRRLHPDALSYCIQSTIIRLVVNICSGTIRVAYPKPNYRARRK